MEKPITEDRANQLCNSISSMDNFKALMLSIVVDYVHEHPNDVTEEEKDDLKLMLIFLLGL